jgi:hypothetical protein
MNAFEQMHIATNFGVTDWAIVIVFLVSSVIAGMWAMRYIKDMDDYVVAGRSVRTYLGLASIIASELGLVTVMYSAQMGFTKRLRGLRHRGAGGRGGFHRGPDRPDRRAATTHGRHDHPRVL